MIKSIVFVEKDKKAWNMDKNAVSEMKKKETLFNSPITSVEKIWYNIGTQRVFRSSVLPNCFG